MATAPRLLICMQQRYAPNPVCCANHGSKELKQALGNRLEQAGLAVEITESGCLGMCGMGPNLKLEPTGKVWNRVAHDMLDEVVQFLMRHEHSTNGRLERG
ncbi:MAG TPA: (2Fe-2S) ferredoxin domain-containing protein [Methylophilaceae bacterium]|nr:(2Fe-2S) ferredoxin domain-containing protein [Methylophilaceae bacterium]